MGLDMWATLRGGEGEEGGERRWRRSRGKRRAFNVLDIGDRHDGGVREEGIH